ncbi:MAG: aminoacyl-tRNA hydrolase [Candidatus Promineifilaceae bacterium]
MKYLFSSELSRAQTGATDDIGQSDALQKKLIIGLGNPGRQYAKNRHNIGFMVIDRLAQKYEIGISRKKHNAYLGTGRIGDRLVVLAKPQTYVNRSGDSAVRLSNFYDIQPADILVIYDEIDLPIGTLRIRERGGSGGHNGMKSVISRIGQDFPRMRLGVDRPPGRMDPSTYVLRDFEADEWLIVDEMISEALAAIEMIFSDGLDLAMTHFNGTATSNQ